MTWRRVNPSLESSRSALEITAAPDVVQDALRDRELIRAAGADKNHPTEGLEPVFELLETALKTAQKVQRSYQAQETQEPEMLE